MLLSEDIGQPKKEEDTPKEHQHQVGWTLPPEPVAHIVDGFQAAHYGQSEVDGGQMRGLLQDLDAVQQHVTERKKAESDSAADEKG